MVASFSIRKDTRIMIRFDNLTCGRVSNNEYHLKYYEQAVASAPNKDNQYYHKDDTYCKDGLYNFSKYEECVRYTTASLFIKNMTIESDGTQINISNEKYYLGRAYYDEDKLINCDHDTYYKIINKLILDALANQYLKNYNKEVIIKNIDVTLTIDLDQDLRTYVLFQALYSLQVVVEKYKTNDILDTIGVQLFGKTIHRLFNNGITLDYLETYGKKALNNILELSKFGKEKSILSEVISATYEYLFPNNNIPDNFIDVLKSVCTINNSLSIKRTLLCAEYNRLSYDNITQKMIEPLGQVDDDEYEFIDYPNAKMLINRIFCKKKKDINDIRKELQNEMDKIKTIIVKLNKNIDEYGIELKQLQAFKAPQSVAKSIKDRIDQLELYRKQDSENLQYQKQCMIETKKKLEDTYPQEEKSH